MSLSFAEGVVKAYQTKWSLFNNFSVEIQFQGSLKDKIGWNDEVGKNLEFYVTNMTTPQLTTNPIEEYIADRYKFYNGKENIYQFTITFKDFEQMSLYKMFSKAFVYQRSMYFDEIKSTVIVYKEPDYLNESKSIIWTMENTLISGVSALTFSNENASQISEFSVDFKTNTLDVGK